MGAVNAGRRRFRLREVPPTPYVAQAPEDDRYTPPPPDPDDGPRRRSFRPPIRPLGLLTFREACLAYPTTHQDAPEGWRANFPGSAEVHDGVHVSEAGVVPLDETFTLDDEESDDE